MCDFRPAPRSKWDITDVSGHLDGNSFLHILAVCISVYLKSVLRYKVLILDSIVRKSHLREQGCEDPWLFFKAKRGSASKMFGTIVLHYIACLLRTSINNNKTEVSW
jgi:hypothetical protein